MQEICLIPRPITAACSEDAYTVLRANESYCILTEGHPAERGSVESDLTALPPGKSMADKHYWGWYDKTECMAVTDLIVGYPDGETLFIGLLIVDAARHGQGYGTFIFGQVEAFARERGCKRMELGCYEHNGTGLAFWRGKGFTEKRRTDRTVNGVSRTLLVLERALA